MSRDMIKAVKKFYSRPFMQEIRSPVEIVLYRLLLLAAWTVYRVKYRRVLQKTRLFIEEAAQDIRKKGKSAFVFANGPSMADIDLAKINALCESDECDLIAINSYLSKSAHIAPPRFAVFADNVHFAGGETQYTKDVETCERLGITYFAPAKYCEGPSNLRRAFCSICNIDSRNTADITKPAGYYGVTALFALSLAKSLGYKRIYICGYDNSYFRDFEVGEDREMLLRHKHYYDSKESDTLVKCLYNTGSEFFFDTFRHFKFIEKISGSGSFLNIARTTYITAIQRDLTMDFYKIPDRDQ